MALTTVRFSSIFSHASCWISKFRKLKASRCQSAPLFFKDSVATTTRQVHGICARGTRRTSFTGMFLTISPPRARSAGKHSPRFVKQSRKKAWWPDDSVVFTTREHVIAIGSRRKGMLGVTLRYPLELRNEVDYFGDILDDMLDLPTHIVETEAGHFAPKKFEGHYETRSQN